MRKSVIIVAAALSIAPASAPTAQEAGQRFGLNVQPVETVGAIFDPRVHEALEMVERPDLPDHQVFEEVRRGYKIKDLLLRPALVRVVTNPSQKEI